MANSHPGSYCGQDAYNDMLVTENRNDLVHGKWSNKSGYGRSDRRAQLYARPTGNNYEGGQSGMNTIVRRLTELECERLQGLPSGWTDIGEWEDTNGKKHQTTASARYKALGNSIATPFWQYLARRICAQYERDITIGSLFDGIGGFPYVFERCGAKAVWASEIEEFPIAVTKRHFPEE